MDPIWAKLRIQQNLKKREAAGFGTVRRKAEPIEGTMRWMLSYSLCWT